MITSARERSLPVVEPFRHLFPEQSLVRGRVLGCTGPAAVSAATALVAVATSSGSWLAVVGAPWFGVEAAREAGVALERVVSIDADPHRTAAWAERVVAALDGFEVVLAAPPADLARGGATMRRVHQRVRARGALLVLAGARDIPGAGTGAIDVVISTTTPEWIGVGDGHGHVRGRRVAVTASGRRAPRAVTAHCWLPSPSGAVALVDDAADGLPLDRRDELEWGRTG